MRVILVRYKCPYDITNQYTVGIFADRDLADKAIALECMAKEAEGDTRKGNKSNYEIEDHDIIGQDTEEDSWSWEG